MPASRQAPRFIQHPRKKTIGLRIPGHKSVLTLLEILDGPILSASLMLPGRDLPETDPEEIERLLGNTVDLIMDAGSCGVEHTTVVDLTGDAVEMIRQGKGDWRQIP